MTAAILKREMFGSPSLVSVGSAPVTAAIAPAVTKRAPAADDAPPVRRHTPLVELYREEIAEFLRRAIPVAFGLALFVVV